jgi:hypothetical protein
LELVKRSVESILRVLARDFPNPRPILDIGREEKSGKIVRRMMNAEETRSKQASADDADFTDWKFKYVPFLL